MVYRGKPSTGCAKCRQRKIKCDERPGGCLNCANKNHVCPGYRAQIDLMFHDESAEVEVKATKAKAKAIERREERRSKSLSKSRSPSAAPIMDVALAPTLDERGMGFFITHYACGIDGPTGPGHDSNTHLSTYGFDRHISTVMVALGLAGISSVTNDPDMMTHATQCYLKALTQTNAALSSPIESRKDTTLLSTALLAVFETLTGSSHRLSFGPWSRHVGGSAMLVKVRGSQQFSTFSGRRLYVNVLSNRLMTCIATDSPVPDYIHHLNREASPHFNPEAPEWLAFLLLADYTDFRSQVKHGIITDLHAILERALHLDGLAKNICEKNMSDSQYQYAQTDRPVDGIFGGVYHIYPYYLAATMWNVLRNIRIYLNDIIRNTLTIGFSTQANAFAGQAYIDAYDEATTTLIQMQADIIASIPQHLGYTPSHVDASGNASPGYSNPLPRKRAAFEPRFLWSNFSDGHLFGVPTASNSSTRIPLIRLSGGYPLCWSLYVAGAASNAAPSVQEYVIRTLDQIADEFGVNQARIMARSLERKIQFDAEKIGKIQLVPDYLPTPPP